MAETFCLGDAMIDSWKRINIFYRIMDAFKVSSFFPLNYFHASTDKVPSLVYDNDSQIGQANITERVAWIAL